MATPKKRTGKAKQNARRANWKGSTPATTTCPNCKAVVLTHTVCPECGYYKDGFASIKKADEAKAEAPVEVKEEKTEEVKKTRKPRAKKAEAAVEEVKEEIVAEASEEVKTEE